MTEEQQNILYEAAIAIGEAAKKLANTIYDIFIGITKVARKLAKTFVECISRICKQIKKYRCNNWRRINGLPMIKRSTKRRQEKIFHQLL